MRTVVSAVALAVALASPPALAADTYKEDLIKVANYGIIIGRAAG